MTLDLEAARVFLAVLDPDASAFTFQVFAEAPESTVRPRHMHGTLAGIGEKLAAINQSGGGIFVTVNATDGLGRAAGNVVALRSLFIDCDKPRIRPLALPPSLSVATSPRRGHHYWLLQSGEPAEAFTPVQQRLAAYYGSDATVKDLGRVLRLPGFCNVKHVPVLVRLVRCRPHLRYTIAEVAKAHPLKDARLLPEQDHVTHPRSSAEALYFRWRRSAPFTTGTRNDVAFRLALEGFAAGLDARLVEAEVRGYCDRCGIGREAAAVLRSARKIAARRLRHSSPLPPTKR